MSSVIFAHIFASKNRANNSLKNNNKNKEKIIIIGAGVAVLIAGKTLQNKGFKVILLEGRNPIGSRYISTFYFLF